MAGARRGSDQGRPLGRPVRRPSGQSPLEEDDPVGGARKLAVQVRCAERLAALDEARSDLRDLAPVFTRAATDPGERVSLDGVLDTFGLTREQLNALPDED